ncbi:MAG: subclass B1 metallo-beta-lactamase [Muricauda sp.]|nr:subclass B1 metallo-beta-lactamase [Allomuricauda sp.]
MKQSLFPVLALLFLLGCKSEELQLGYETDTLKIVGVTEHTYQHISYLQTDSFGKVACNGMIVMDGKEAIVLDTPVNNTVSEELINWLEKQDIEIKAVVATHFHDDCLGGLKAFHNKQIPSYALDKTIELARKEEATVPKNNFSKTMELEVDTKKLLLDYAGEGHTKDNIIGYFPSERVMFGGCLIKSVGAGKGYLGDANVEEWPKTVTNIKSKYKDMAIVVPGHGNSGNVELLDYTITLFKE